MNKRFFLLLILCLCASFAFAQEARFELSNHLPNNTLVYMGLDNSTKLAEEFQKLGIVQLALDPSVKELLEEFKVYQQQALAMLQSANFDEETLAALFAGEIAVALCDIEKPAGECPIPNVNAVISWDLGEAQAQISQMINMLVMMSPIEPKQITIKEVNVLRFDLPMCNFPILIAFKNTAVVIATNEKTMEYILDPAKDTLAQYPAFKSAKNKLLPNKYGSFFYFNFAATLNILFRELPEIAEVGKKIANILELDKIESLTSSMTFENGEILEKFYLYMPNRKEVKEKTATLLSFIPQNVFFFEHYFVELDEAYKKIEEVINALPKDAQEMALSCIKQAEKELGFSIKEFCNSFGNEILETISCNGGMIPDIAVQFTCKNVESLQKIASILLRRLPEKYIKSSEWNGHKFVYIIVESSKESFPITPTFGFVNNRMIIALYPETFKRMIAPEAGKVPAEVKDLYKTKNLCYDLVINIKDFTDPIYKTVVPLLPSMFANKECPIDLVKLPSSEVIKKYITNIYNFILDEKEGVYCEYHSPFGQVLAGLASYFIIDKLQESIADRIDEDDEDEEDDEDDEAIEDDEDADEEDDDDEAVEDDEDADEEDDDDEAVEDEDQAVEDEDQAVEDEDQAVEDEDQAVEDEDQAVEDEDQAVEDDDEA